MTLRTGQVQPAPALADTTKSYSRHDTPAPRSTLQMCRSPVLETTFPLEDLRGHLATVHSNNKDSVSSQTDPVDHANADSSDNNMDVSVKSGQVEGSVSFASDHIGFLSEDQILERAAEANMQIRAEKRKKTKAIADKANQELLATLFYQYQLKEPFKLTPLGKMWRTTHKHIWYNAMIPQTLTKRPKKEVDKESIQDIA